MKRMHTKVAAALALAALMAAGASSAAPAAPKPAAGKPEAPAAKGAAPHASATAPPAMFDPANLRRYWLGLLARGPKWTPTRTPHTDSVQAAHLANIGAMFDAGALVVAGPFLDALPLRGIFVFTCDSAEAVRRTASDAAIAEGRLALELHPMMGRKGLGDRTREWRTAGSPLADSLVRYSFGFLTTGPKADPSNAAEMEKLQKGHMAHLLELNASGKLRFAGPLLGGGKLEGIYVFDAPAEEARKLASGDPMIQAGWLELEIRPWMTALGAMP